MLKKIAFMSSVAMVSVLGCRQGSHSATQLNSANDSVTVSGVDTSTFNTSVDNHKVALYRLKNSKGYYADITSYGGRVVSLVVPDKEEKPVDVVLGYAGFESYRKKGEPFFGAVIGRYGNRIAKGKFILDGRQYTLELNDGPNSLHGGFNGFYSKVWDVTAVTDSTLNLRYRSPDGEAGYPGNLTADVKYTFTQNNTLKIDYAAVSDKETVINLTNHAYFNLSGAGSKTITDHLLTIHAQSITPVDSTLIPTGRLRPVKGTPFDFNTEKAIGQDISAGDEQLKFGKGYDHNYVLDTHSASTPVAVVKSPVTGITMEIFTTEPGLQFYSGNFMDGKSNDGKGGKSYPHRAAFCLETQHFPDSPNQPAFPSTVLKPGQVYKSTTTYRFLNK